MRCAVEAAKINRRLLPVKSTYFFFLAGFGSLVPYIAVYMKMIGWSPSETALTCGIVCIITAFSRTFIGGVADKLNAHKTVLVVMCLLSAVFHGSMLFVPQRTSQETSHRATDVQLHCGTHAARVFACSGRPADDQNKEIMVSISSKSEGEPYAGDGATACRWTCRIRQQQNNTQQTEQVCFVRSFNKKCITLFDATTFAFGVTKFQRRPAEDCQAMESSVSDVLSCHCYTVLSFVVGHDTFEQMVCQNQTTLTCSTDYCDPFGGYIVHNASRWSPSVERTGFDVGWTFWCVAILYLLGQMTIQPVFGLADAMAFTTLGKDRNKWGRQRLWGTLGFALFGLTSGLLMDVFDHIKNEYTVAFLLFAVFMILASVSACQYNMRGLDVTSPSQVCRDVLGLMRRPDAFVLFCVVLIFGMYQGLIGTFLFWYLKLLGDVPQVLLGLCLVHSAGPETVMLFYSGMIIQKIGHVFCISIVFVAFAVRMTSYSLLRNPWIVLCIEPLHSITFGLMYATASTYASRITPPGTHGSVQSILGALFLGFGRSFGVLLGGPLIETYGGAITFRMFGVSSLVFLILYLIAQKFWIQSVETLEVIEMKVPKEQQAKETDDYEEEHRMLDIQDGDKVRNDDIVKHECSVSDEQVT